MVESHEEMPHALKVAHEKLIVELDKGIELSIPTRSC